ncbi:ATP-binding protein [Nonomuraea typhae]|uniref:ATP-binding protein n=1 Tax=Nonomuraea typhae TaxID=2603600 RepID=UPI0012FC3B71|nr:ATP-binding protein [Nonomuraea typhae]
MDTHTQHTSLAELSSPLHSPAFLLHRQEPVGEEFPDLAPGLMMSTLRAARLWGGMAWRRAFPGRGDQSALARGMVGQLLADTARVEDAVWVTAELVSNALQHSCSGRERGFFVVEVLRGAASVRIVVYDLGGGPAPDFSRTLGTLPEAEEGRGLAGVAKLAARTGAAGDEVTGRAVWAELALAEQARGSASDVTAAGVTAGHNADAQERGGTRELLPAERPGSGRREEGVRLDPSAALREAS